MKLIIDIPKEVVVAIENGVDYRYDIHTAIAQGVPYEERPKGEWHGNNFDEHSCPLCGHPALYEEEPDGYYEVQSNFCPECGADMRKEAESD